VDNVPPTPNAGGDEIVTEGTAWSRERVALDPGALDDLSGAVRYGADADEVPLAIDPATRAYTLAYDFPRPEELEITVTVTDDAGGLGVETFTVEAINVPPVADCGAGATVREGEPLIHTCTWYDPGVDEVTGEVSYYEGGARVPLTLEPEGTFELRHTYAIKGTYTVTVTLSDPWDEGGTTLEVTVGNAPPRVDAGPDATLVEGGTLSQTGFVYDTGPAGSLSATVDYGDGGGPGPLTVASDRSFTLSHRYLQDGVYTVLVAITDGEGDTGTDTLTVTVTNAPPEVEAGGDVSLVQGQPIGRDVVITDPGELDEVTVTVDFGDGSTPWTVPLEGASGIVHLDHAYTGLGHFQVTVIAVDDAGAEGLGTFVVTVGNAPPIVDAGGDVTIDEGDRLVRAITFADPGDDAWSATLDPGDGSPTVHLPEVWPGEPFELDHVYPRDGIYEVVVTVSDGLDEGEDRFTVTVKNVAPTVDIGGPGAAAEGSPWTRTGNWHDPGIDDPMSATVDFGDGSGPRPLDLDPDGTFELHHVYPRDGTYTVTVIVSDGQANGVDAAQVLVANVAPVVFAGDDVVMDEGATLSRTVTFEDPGADTWTATVDWDDGSPPSSVPVGTDKTVALHHVYLDDGEHTVTIWIDDGTEVGSGSFHVTVVNVPPTVNAGGPVSMVEGGTLSRRGTVTDPGALDTFTATVDYGAGGEPDELVIHPDRTFDLEHTYQAAGQYTVTVVVTDKDGGLGDDSFSVTVSNTAPIVDAGPNAAIDEGDTLVRVVSFTDPGVGPWTATVDYGDGAGPTSAPVDQEARTVALERLFPDDGLFEITVAVSDGVETGYGAFLLTVHNVAPTVDIGGPIEVDEGTPWSRWGSFTDPGVNDTHTGTVDYGAGAGAKPLALTPDRTFELAHTWPDVGEHTLTVTIHDGKDAGTATAPVTVRNVAPTLHPITPPNLAVGQAWSTTGTFSDPGEDTWTVTIDYGDGGALVTHTVTTRSFPIHHTYWNPGTYQATFHVADDDGGEDSLMVMVEVGNVAPIVDAGPDRTVDEGSPLTLVASFTDPGNDSHTATIAWLPGQPAPAAVDPDHKTVTGTHTYPDDGVFDVLVRVTDEHGAWGEDSARVTVVNVAPVVDAGGDVILDESGVLSRQGSFTDPGDDEWTVTVSWGDGSDPETIPHTEDKTFQLSHQYTESGRFTVTVTVTDDDGGVGQASFQVTVVILDCSEIAPIANGSAIWLGGAVGAAKGWSVADNWEPPKVPDAATPVALCAGNLDYPTLTEASAAASIRMASEATIATAGWTLTVHGSLAGGAVTGSGRVDMVGAGALASETPQLRIAGPVLAQAGAAVKGTLTVEGTGTLELDGVLLNVGGGMTVWVTGGGGGLVLDEPADAVRVHGAFSARGLATSEPGAQPPTSAHSLTDGTLYLRGGFSQVGDHQATDAFVAKGTRVVFEGPSRQIISFQTPGPNQSRFADVDVIGLAELGSTVVVTGHAQVTGSGRLEGPHRLEVTSALPAVSPGAKYSVAVTAVIADVTLAGDVTLPNAGALLVSDNSGSLTLGPHTLTVAGDLRVVRGGRAGSGLYMSSANSELLVAGEMTFHGQGSAIQDQPNPLSAGVIRLRGGFSQTGSGGRVAFAPAGTLTRVEGTGVPQPIRFEAPAHNRFDTLEIAPGAHAMLASAAAATVLRATTAAHDVAEPELSGAFPLRVMGVEVDGLRVVGTPLEIDASREPPVQFDRVTFEGYPPHADQLTVRAEELDATFVGLRFLGMPGPSGAYIAGIGHGDSATKKPTLTVVGALPHHGLPGTYTTQGFVIVWGSPDADTDDDQLLDVDEFALGTDVLNPDTDGDGFLDGTEVGLGTDPLDPFSVPFILGVSAEYAVGHAPARVAVGNINPATPLDLAVANEGSNSVTVRFGQSASPGTFGPATTIALGQGASPRGLAMGDLYGGAGAEIAVALTGLGRVRIYQWSSTLGFQEGPTTEVGPEPLTVTLDDMNGDGDLQIVVACFGDDSVRVLSRPLSPAVLPWLSATYAVGDGPVDVATGVVPSSALPGFATANLVGESVTVYWHRPDGALQHLMDVDDMVATGVVMADLSGDGDVELAILDENTRAVWVLDLHDPGGVRGPFRVGAGARLLAVGDLDGNGAPDLVTAATEDDVVSVLLQGVGPNRGRFFRHTLEGLPEAGEVHAILEDVDGDGLDDVVIVNEARNSVLVLRHGLSVVPGQPIGGAGP